MGEQRQSEGRTDGQMEECCNLRSGANGKTILAATDGRTEGWIDGWTEGRIDGRMDGRTYGKETASATDFKEAISLP